MSDTGIEETTIVFFGTPKYVQPVLQGLVDAGYSIAGVVTQPDRPSGRGNKSTPSPIKQLALDCDLSVYTPEKINADFVTFFKTLNPDLVVLAAYGLILPQELLAIPRFGFLNIHPSLLPLYRGATPMRAAILDGVSETGVSIMKMDHKMDHGPIVSQCSYALGGSENILDLYTNLFDLGTKLLLESIPRYIAGKLTPWQQDHEHATVTSLLSKADGLIDWSQDVLSIERHVRAFLEWPGSYCFLNGLKIIITQSRIASEIVSSGKNGQVRLIDSRLFVHCGTGVLEILELIPAGKRKMAAQDFIQGSRAIDGALLDTK